MRQMPLRFDLSRSHYSCGAKSCPECSRRHGFLFFRPLSEFGRRNDNGVDRIQPWCITCRSRRRKPLQFDNP